MILKNKPLSYLPTRSSFFYRSLAYKPTSRELKDITFTAFYKVDVSLVTNWATSAKWITPELNPRSNDTSALPFKTNISQFKSALKKY